MKAEALFDGYGRRPCYAFQHGKCPDGDATTTTITTITTTATTATTATTTASTMQVEYDNDFDIAHDKLKKLLYILH